MTTKAEKDRQKEARLDLLKRGFDVTLEEAPALLEAVLYLEGLEWTVEQRGNTYVITDKEGTEYDPISKDQLIGEAEDQEWIDWTEKNQPWWNTDEWGLYPADEDGAPATLAEAQKVAQWFISQQPGKPATDEGVALRAAIEDAERKVQAALASGQTEVARARLMPELADLRARYAQYQQGLGIGGEEDLEGQIYGSYSEAEANAPPGFRPTQRSDGTWGYERKPEEPRRSLDQTIEDYIIAGDIDKAIALYTTWENMTKPKGLTPDQAASYIMGLAIAPDEMEEWIGALTDDWNAPRTPQERVQAPLTAAERNAMPTQAPIEMGAGIPAGVAGAGAGGLQFPSWLESGMPPTGAQAGLTPAQRAALGEQEAMLEEQGGGQALTPEEIEARRGIFSGDGTGTQTTGIFGTTPQQLSWLAAENAKRQGQQPGMGAGGIFGGVTTPIEQQVPGIFDSTKGILEPVPTPVTGVMGTQQKKPFSSIPMTIYEGGAVEGLSPTLPEGGFLPPELLGDLEAQGAASGATVGRYGYSADQFANMPPPANETEARKKAMGQPYQTVYGFTFAPTLGYKTKQQEIDESNLADQQRQIFATPTAQAMTPAAMWKRGDIAPFERNIFQRPTPLSEQDALLQMKYRDWSQQRQKAFEAKPVRRAIFK